MNRREEFLIKALKARREYQAASSDIREMLEKGESFGAEWHAAVARQKAALVIWSSLPRKYAAHQKDDEIKSD